MLNEQGKRIDWHSENFNKEREKKKTELKNATIEVKNTLEGINRRLVDTEKISNLEDRLIDITPV